MPARTQRREVAAATLLAEAVDLDPVLAMEKRLLVGDHFQHAFQPVVGEFDHPATALADEVLMGGLVGGGFVALESVPEIVGPDQSAFHQQIERAIDRGRPDRNPPASELLLNPDNRGVIGNSGDRVGDLQPLARHRQAPVAQVAGEIFPQRWGTDFSFHSAHRFRMVGGTRGPGPPEAAAPPPPPAPAPAPAAAPGPQVVQTPLRPIPFEPAALRPLIRSAYRAVKMRRRSPSTWERIAVPNSLGPFRMVRKTQIPSTVPLESSGRRASASFSHPGPVPRGEAILSPYVTGGTARRICGARA